MPTIHPESGKRRYLRARLPFFSGPARVFALAILVQNGIELDDVQFREFIEGALTIFYGIPIADSVAHSERIQKALLDVVDTGKEEAARKAAERLLGHAKEKLDDRHYARCRVLTLDGSEWRNPEFAIELERMRDYPEYAALVVQEAKQQVQRGFKHALIVQIYEAQQNPSLWEDIVWNAICTRSPGSRIGSQGQWILEFMLKVQDSRQAIGKAARKFLFDKRISQEFNTDESSSWLALLAHEGGELSKEELGEIVDRIDPIDKCAFVPLVTRLGRAPGNTRPRHPSYSALPPINESDQITPETATFERFLEFARPEAQFHPNFWSLIEQSLYNDPFSDEQLQHSPHTAGSTIGPTQLYCRYPSLAQVADSRDRNILVLCVSERLLSHGPTKGTFPDKKAIEKLIHEGWCLAAVGECVDETW